MNTPKDAPAMNDSKAANTEEAAPPDAAQPVASAGGAARMRLKHFPVSFFAVIMGLAGLVLAWRKMAEYLGTSGLFSHALGIATLALFILLAGIYLLKAARHPRAVREELNHPVMSAFFPTISISLLLLALCLLPLSRGLALTLWGAGVVMHLLLTLHVVRSWIDREDFKVGHINPAWFIPAVGNVVVPLAGVPLGHAELSWFFFAVGISLWIILLVIVFYRILFHDPLPPMLLPTLFILIAPPAVGFLSYVKLNGGEVDAFARVLYHLALFFTLLLLVELPRFARLPFFLSWWAYSFPSAAITTATFVMAEHFGGGFLALLAPVMLVALTALIVVLVLLTLKAVREHRICVPRKH